MRRVLFDADLRTIRSIAEHPIWISSGKLELRLSISGSETSLVVKASRAIPLNPSSGEGGHNNCGYGKLTRRRPWLGVAGSIPGRIRGVLAWDGRERWCPCRTANR